VTLSVQDPLVRLLKSLDPDIEIIGGADQPPAFDYHCPLLSLPLGLGATLETLAAPERYLASHPAARARWRERLPATAKPRIGLVWSGAAGFKKDHNRSLTLNEVRPLLSIDADWICLQKDHRPTDTAALAECDQLRRCDLDLGDFADTAALIDLLDLVVTADTSVAHLAGALGRPVWILLPHSPDWRWLLDRDDSPWYPSARLFRQPAPGDWASVIDGVRRKLAALPGQFPSTT
jgi:hypothetical protein